MVSMIERACASRGIALRTRSDEWVLELSKGGILRRVVGAEFGFNDQAAVALARDKVATGVILEDAKLRHIPHRLVQSRGDTTYRRDVLEHLLRNGRGVLKPLLGGAGNLVQLVKTADDAVSIMNASQDLGWAISPHVDAEYELRVVILDDEILLAHKKTNPAVVNGLKLFNLSKGAHAEVIETADVEASIIELVRAAASALRLRLAAVDMLVGRSGVAILEVNAAFSLTHFAKTNPAAYNQAAGVYDRLIDAMF